MVFSQSWRLGRNCIEEERGTVQGKKEVFYPRGLIDDLTGLKMKIQGNLKFFFNSDIVTL